MARLANRKVLIVGASTGIGLATGRAFAREGAHVALAARSAERLRAAADEIGEAALAVECDAADAESARAAVAHAAEAFGGLSDLVYAAGVAHPTKLSNAEAEDWRRVFEVNVLGATLVTQAALPHLVERRGRALYLSSIITDDNPPRIGMGLYSTTKAALDRLIECWQSEERAVSFTRVSVGDTHGTDFANGWQMETLMPFVKEWNELGYLAARTMAPEDVALHLVALLEGREGVPVSYVTPRFIDPD